MRTRELLLIFSYFRVMSIRVNIARLFVIISEVKLFLFIK